MNLGVGKPSPVPAPGTARIFCPKKGVLAVVWDDGSQSSLIGDVPPIFITLATATGVAGSDVITFSAAPPIEIGDVIHVNGSEFTVAAVVAELVTLDAPLADDLAETTILKREA